MNTAELLLNHAIDRATIFLSIDDFIKTITVGPRVGRELEKSMHVPNMPDGVSLKGASVTWHFNDRDYPLIVSEDEAFANKIKIESNLGNETITHIPAEVNKNDKDKC